MAKRRNKKLTKGVDYIGVGVGAVIIDNKGRLFLAKRGKKASSERGLWECPGGGMEIGETFEETIIREMKEEFGIELKVLELLGIINHYIKKEKKHWIAVALLCKIKKGTPKILEPEKCSEIGWFSLKEFEKLPHSVVYELGLKGVLKQKFPKGLPEKL